MSIRKKLLLSYIAMIAVPIVVFVLTAITIVSLFLNNVIGFAPLTKLVGDSNNVKDFRATMETKSEWTSGLKFIAGHEPERLAEPAFLQETEATLQPLGLAMVIERGGVVDYRSPSLAALDDKHLTDELKRFDDEVYFGFHDNQIKLGGDTYTISTRSFHANGGTGAGAIYILEEDRVSAFARVAFLTVLGFVVLVVATTNGVLTFFVSRSIIRPLYRLKAAAEQIKEGNLDNELKFSRKGEIGQLSAAFEEMRIRLRASIRAQLQAEENRKELLSNISHDLKTPITAIAACAEGMRDGIADTPEKRAKYIEMIHSKASHMDALIDELFLYSKLDLKRLPFHFELTDINAYLQAFAEELSLHPQYAGIRIVYEHRDERPVPIIADREKLGRVIANITGNSLKHMDKQAKEIRIGLRRSDGAQEVAVAISDNGKGIDAEGLPYIFDRFYRTDASRNTDSGGSGLGLAIVKQIIEEHGGTVRAQSVLGEGTTILFTLKTPEGYKGERHDEHTDHRG